MEGIELIHFIKIITSWIEAAYQTLQIRYIFISYGIVYILAEISPLQSFFQPRSEVKKRLRKFLLGMVVFTGTGYVFYLRKIAELKILSDQNDYLANLVVSYITIIILHHIGLKKAFRSIREYLRPKPQVIIQEKGKKP